MPDYDLALRGARVLTSSSDGIADIAVADGRIVAVGEVSGSAKEDHDASGKVISPGGVDVHCHIEQLSGMGLMNADTFETATRSALIGGTTTTVSFVPQTQDTIAKSIDDYAQRAKRGTMTDYAFHLIVSDLGAPNAIDDLTNAIRAGHRSIKVFTTYNIQLNDREICDVLALSRKEGALVCIHAENDGLIQWMKDRLLTAGKTEPRWHAVSHPRLAEIEAVERMIRFAEFFATPIMLFHISTREAVDAIRKAKARGLPVWAETCPHYLFMDASVLDHPGDEGAKWMCSPPQRTTDDQTALWDGLSDGTISLVSSDHAPYRYDETGKLSAGAGADFTQKANGLPGLEVRMPLMFDAMVSTGNQDGMSFVNACCTRPAALYGLPNKGDIAPGYDADLVVWDQTAEKTFGPNDLSDNVGYNPWEGRRIVGWPEQVLRRGKWAVRDGALAASPGEGLWIDRPNLRLTSAIDPAPEAQEVLKESGEKTD